MLPKQAISIHRADTPAEEDTETDRTDIVFVPYYASVEQLTSNSWVDQTHVTKSTVLNLTKTDAVEVKWEANALLRAAAGHVAGGAADGLLLSAQPAREDGVLHLTDEACSAPAEAFGSADFFAGAEAAFDRPPAVWAATPCSTRSFSARRTARWTITLRMSAPTVGEVRGNGMLCLIPSGRLHRRGDHAVS